MNPKFIFMLCWIFYICKNVTSFKTENTSLPIQKLQSLTISSASDGLKANQGKDTFPASSKIVQNASSHSWDTWNSSSKHTTKPPQAHFGSKTTIIKKEKEITLPRNDSAFVVKLPVNISSNVTNVSLYGTPVNLTTTEGSVQTKIIKTYLVSKSPEKENITSNSTRDANMVEAQATKGSPRERWARAKTESVEDLMDKLFGEDFSEVDKKRQRQSDKSRERSSRRRQKMKKPGRFGEEEVFYFRDAETTGAGTTASGAGETTTKSGTETTAAGGGETTAAGGGETTAAGGGETTAAGGGETTATGGGETTASGGGKTTASGGGETTAVSGGDTAVSGGEITTVSGGEIAAVSGGEITVSNGSETPITGLEGTNVNYHYHFHYFGVSPPQPPKPASETTKPPTASTPNP